MKKAFYFLLIFSLGAASGWYFADPKNQKLMRNLPKEWQDPAKVSNLLLNSVSNIPRTVMRLYDDKMPQNIKDSLADGLPAVFGHPFVCRIERVFTTNSESGANPRVRVDSSAGTRQLGQKSLIRAGDHFTGSPPKLSVELKCGNLEFVFGPGANVKLIRGEGARKVLVVNGSVNVRASGASKFGFSHPFGEVNVDTRSYANLQVVGSSKINSINVFDGKLLVTWEVGATTKSKKAVLRILNGPNASIRVLRKKGSEEETRVLGPRKQISFLANGKLSGSGKVTKVMTPPSSSGGEGGVALKNMDIVKKTPKGAKKIDVTMNWRIEPVNRNAPCEVDLASDQKFSNILAEYKSDQNALLIKGMKPGIYFWRARCEINGDEEKSKTGRITVIDSSKSKSAPQLKSPSNGARVITSAILFKWTPVRGAKSYVLQLSRKKNFGKFNEYRAKQGTGLKMNLKQKGIYYWRVYSTGKLKSSRSPYSKVRRFIY